MACVIGSHLASGLGAIYIDLVLGLAAKGCHSHNGVILPLPISLVVCLETASSHHSDYLFYTSKDSKYLNYQKTLRQLIKQLT